MVTGTRQVVLNLADQFYEQLRARAERRGLTVSAYVRMRVSEVELGTEDSSESEGASRSDIAEK